MSSLLSGFWDSRIVQEDQQEPFLSTLATADRRTSSTIAEAILLVIAFISAFISISHIEALGGGYWVTTDDGGLSSAGFWTMLVSSPIYFFLILRWLWRFGVWAVLLRDISKLDLHLVPTHPDRCCGIGFLTLFPVIFTPLSLVLSLVIAASCLREITFGNMGFEGLRTVWLIWTAMIVILFVGPLTFFSRKLFKTRESAILHFSGIISRIKHDLEHDIERRVEDNERLSTETISASSDIDPAMVKVLGIKVIPIELWAVAPLVLSSLMPFLVVAATLISVGDLFKRLLALAM